MLRDRARSSGSSTSCWATRTGRSRSRTTRRSRRRDGRATRTRRRTRRRRHAMTAGRHAVVNAAQSPPFMTAHRVVVVRDIGQPHAAERSRSRRVSSPTRSTTTRLVLVAGAGAPRRARKELKAAKAHGTVVAPATEQTADVLAAQLDDAGIAARPRTRSQLVAEHLGEDAGRVVELVEVLRHVRRRRHARRRRRRAVPRRGGRRPATSSRTRSIGATSPARSTSCTGCSRARAPASRSRCTRSR